MIDYKLASLVASGLSSGKALVVEGRQTGMMAAYVRSMLGKGAIRSFFLVCDASVQTERYIEREIGVEEAQQVKRDMPTHADGKTMAEFVPFIQNVVSSTTMPSAVLLCVMSLQLTIFLLSVLSCRIFHKLLAIASVPGCSSTRHEIPMPARVTSQYMVTTKCSITRRTSCMTP